MQYFGPPGSIAVPARPSALSEGNSNAPTTQRPKQLSPAKVLVKAVSAEVDDMIHSMGARAVKTAKKFESEETPRIKLYDLAKECVPLNVRKEKVDADGLSRSSSDSGLAPLLGRVVPKSLSPKRVSPSAAWYALGRPSYDFVDKKEI